MASWKKSRGKLGVFAPLIGSWRAKAETPMGALVCERAFTLVLNGKYIQLAATWKFKATKGATPRAPYEELCLFGSHKDHGIAFWSFTSDVKRSEGRLTEAPDIHPMALSFEAQMDAGLARQTYWPGEDDGMRWCVESRTKKGWNRFVEHHYERI